MTQELIEQAKVSRDKELYERALAQLAAALAQDPENQEAKKLVAEITHILGHGDIIGDNIVHSNVLNMDSNTPLILLSVAQSAIAAEDYPKAIEHLEEALSKNPGDEAVIALMAKAKQKRREQLTEHVKTLINKSQAAMAEREYDAAISLLESILKLAKDDPHIAALAREQTVEIKLEQARREKDLEHRLHTARNAFAVGNYDEARHILSRHFADTRNNPEAEKLLRQIEDAWQLWDSARLAMNDKQYATAHELLQELQERFPQSGREVREMQRRADHFLLVEQAKSALRQDAIEEAESYYRQAIRNAPRDENERATLQVIEEALSRKLRAADLGTVP